MILKSDEGMIQQNKGQIVAVRYSHKDYKATLRYFFNHSGNDFNDIISKNNNKQRVNNFNSNDKNSIINNGNDDITVDIHEDTYQVDGIGGTTWDGSLITSKFMEELLLINFSTLLSGLNNIDIDNINSHHANKISRSSCINRSSSSRTINSDNNNNNHDALKYHIVELGCGSGITSIISSMLGCKVTATDRYCDLIVNNIYRVKHKYHIQQNQDRLLHNNNDNGSCSKHNVDDDVYIGDYGHDVDGQNYVDKFLDIHAMTLSWESSSKQQQQQQQQQADSKQNDINRSRDNHKHKDSIHDDYISCSSSSRSRSSSSSSLHSCDGKLNYNTPQSILYNRGDIDIIIGAEITCLIKQQHLLVDIIDELTSSTSITAHEINYNNIHSMGDITDINNRDSDSVRKSSKNDNHARQYSRHHNHTNINNNNPKIIFLSFDGLPDINIHTTKYEINMIKLMKKKKYLYSVVYVGHIEWISNDDNDDDDYKEELMHNTERLRMGSSFPIPLPPPPPPPNHSNRPVPQPLYTNIDHNNDKNLHQNINKTSKAVFHNYTDFYSNRKNDFNFLILFPKSQKHLGTKSLKAIQKSKDHHNNIHSNISIEEVNGYNNEEDNALRLSDNNSHHIIAFYHISSLNTCYRCHKQYLNIKGFNHKISCKYHSGFYIYRKRSSKLNSTMNHNNLCGDGLDYDSNNTIINTNCDVNVAFWDCCGNEDRDCVGCCMSYHEGYK